MSKNTLFLIAVFIGAAVLGYTLSNSGCNRSTSSEDTKEQSETDIPEHDHEAAPSEETSDVNQLLKEAYEAVYTKGVIMEGVTKYKRVLELDSNNIEATYQLGLLSIQSNQLEKAEIRFKKLILLQPENQEYKNLYDDIQKKLGK